MARITGAQCADRVNRVYIIDGVRMLWHRESNRCPDSSYAVILFGSGPENSLRRPAVTIAGPRTECSDEGQKPTFELMLRDLGAPDLRLGAWHRVEPVPLSRPVVGSGPELGIAFPRSGQAPSGLGQLDTSRNWACSARDSACAGISSSPSAEASTGHRSSATSAGLARRRDAYCKGSAFAAKMERLTHVFHYGRYDMVDQHLYFDPKNWNVYLDALRTHVLPRAKRDIPIVLTEFGGPDAKSESRDDDHHTERVEVYLSTLMALDVTEIYYFKLVEPEELNEFGTPSAYAESGLISRETHRPKPAYYVVKKYAARSGR